MSYAGGADYARAQDEADPLVGFRDEFHLPLGPDGCPAVYLCGNSLGLQPKRTAQIVEEELEDWRRLGVEGHFRARRPWMPYHELLAEKSAALVGAQPAEVVSMNTLTVNLHLMMVSFYRPSATRHKILIERAAFPSDRYAVQSQIRYHGYRTAEALLEIGPRSGETALRMDDLEALVEREGHSIALILLPGVQYYNGQIYDMARIAAAARRKGCAVGFDLAHAVGNIPLELHAWGADFAVWCNYKYVNGGPGAVAGCFVHERHTCDASLPRFAGWWGHDQQTRFLMGPEFQPMPGAAGWQLSNPPILSLAPVLASLEIFEVAGMDALREKSLHLTGYLAFLLEQRLREHIEIITPLAPHERGCQLSLRLITGDPQAGHTIFARLGEQGLVCDWREPDVIRVAPVPLYNRYMDVYRFVEGLAAGLQT